jgi:hypothetical protein
MTLRADRYLVTLILDWQSNMKHLRRYTEIKSREMALDVLVTFWLGESTVFITI